MAAVTSVESTKLSAPVGRRRRPRLPYVLLVPAVAVLGLGLGYPLVRQVVMSFQEFGLAQQFGQPPVWVGFGNYVALFTDSYLWAVVARSLVFCLVCASLTMAIGVGMAVLMSRMTAWARIVVQVVLLLVWAMPWMASLTVWQWLIDSQYGIINWLLVRLGLDQFAGHSWLINPISFFAVAMVIVVWMSVPFVAFIVYAGLTQVPHETLEAAQIDGANGWSRFWQIVVPMIKPILMIVGLLQVIWDLKVFTQIFTLQEAGGVTADTNLLGTYIYRLGLGQGDFGSASAVAMFMLVLTVALTFFYVRRMMREEEL
ncbi:MAG: carbohydrate ABC transporter permease [Jiangellaceae bacterium]